MFFLTRPPLIASERTLQLTVQLSNYSIVQLNPKTKERGMLLDMVVSPSPWVQSAGFRVSVSGLEDRVYASTARS